MNIIFYTVVISVIIYFIVKYIANISSKKLSKGIRFILILGLILFAILFALGGRFLLSLPLTLASLALLKLKGLSIFQIISLFRLIQTLRRNGRFSFNNNQNKNSSNLSVSESCKILNLDENKKTILVLGGSLGAKSINEGILNNLSIIRESSFQVLWQTGDYYYDHILSKKIEEKNLVVKSFIKRMDLAYKVADIIISRAGAIAISELSYISKPLILIPSPNVVDDHQRKNANEIFRNGGCLLVEDKDAKDNMLNQAINLLDNSEMKIKMKKSLGKLAKPDAAKNIVSKIYEQI